MTEDVQLPWILCGPILRRLTPDEMVLWWVSPGRFTGKFSCCRYGRQEIWYSCPVPSEATRAVKLGRRAWSHRLRVGFPDQLPSGEKIHYTLKPETGERLKRAFPHLVYPGEPSPSFMVKKQVDTLFHGSCRNPHHGSRDSFLGADRLLARHVDAEDRPALLMLTGDQIYADDAAGPMLHAIHQIIDPPGFPDETFRDAVVTDSQSLYTSA